MQTITNPFPQTGTNSDIDPIGYQQEIDNIKLILTPNVGKQPMIINIYGEYGQGKTTILKYLQNKFKGEWANLSVFEKDISNFADFEKDLVSYQKEHEKEGTEGILVVLDEMQHIDTEGTLSKEQKNFLNTLRKFADNTIDSVDNKKFVLCIAMHPGTKVFLQEHGHLDVEQRIKTFTVNLKDIDYYMAQMLILEHFKKIDRNFTEFFDESFVYSFYVLLSHLEEQRSGLNRCNGRTYSQLFFYLFEFWRKQNKNLTFETLKEILLGKTNLKIGDVKVTLANKEKYFEIYNKLDDSEKFIWDRFVFNPRWHFEAEFENIDKIFIEKLIEKKLISNRKCFILSNEYVSKCDSETLNELRTLQQERIYLNGEKTIIFLDTADEKIYNKLSDLKVNEVYRLNDELLKVIYNFQPRGGDSDDLIKYFEKSPSKKVDCFYNLLLKNIDNDISENDEKRIEKSEVTYCKNGIQYKYINILYKMLGKIKHRIAIFYYAKDYASVEFERYFKDILDELEKLDYDLGLIFVCPYYIDELPKDKVIIKKMENRLFINQISREEMIYFLKKDVRSIDNVIKDSIKLYTQEAVEKGYTMPLTGFKESIDKKPSLFAEKFLEDIKKSWKIEMDKRSGEKGYLLSDVLKSGVDGNGKLINLAKDSLSEFVQLDEYGNILGAKFSKYERKFLELFGSKEEPKKEISKAKQHYFSYFSRFDIEKYVTNILEIKSILEISEDSYKLIEPKDFLKDILSILNSVDINELLKKDQDINIQKSISDLKILLDSFDDKKTENYEKGFYNSEMKKIRNKLKDIEKTNLELNDIIIKRYEDIKKGLNLDLGNVKLEDMRISPYLKNMKQSSELRNLYRMNNIEILSFTHENLEKFLISILILDENYDMDKERLYSLESILDKLSNYNLDKESFELIENLKIKINGFKSPKSRDPNDIKMNLRNLFENSKNNFSTPQLKIVDNILRDFEEYILNPLTNKILKLNKYFMKIKEITETLEDYKTLFGKLNEFNRHDIYLDNIKTFNINQIEIEDELENIEKITKYNLEILEGYLDFIYNNCKKGEIDNIIKIEEKIQNNEKKSVLEYLDYVNGLDSSKYFIKYIQEKETNDRIPEKDLEKIILDIKDSEESVKNLESQKIIDKLLKEGYLRRIIQLEEYYENGRKEGNKSINYKIEGV